MTDIELENKIVSVWRDIVKRCSNKRQEKKDSLSSYIGCTLDDRWKDLGQFSIWYKSQQGYDKQYEVDKDLLFKGNKLYSPDTCVLIPKFLNGILTTSSKARGDLPLGVTFNKPTKTYVARCRYCVDGERKRKTIGYYETPEEAFKAYKAFKEAYIQDCARLYQDSISEAAYSALMAYKLHIDD